MSNVTATQELRAAVISDDTDEIHNQLNAGADINARDDQGFTPLQRAVSRFKNDAVAVLLERGADPELPSTYGSFQTALHIAAQCANEAATKMLLQYHAGLESRDTAQDTPLHLAAASGALEIAKLLIEAGAEIKPLDMNKETPRDIAERVASASETKGKELFSNTATYLQGVERERGVDRESELARQEKLTRDIAALKSHHPERYKIKPKMGA